MKLFRFLIFLTLISSTFCFDISIDNENTQQRRDGSKLWDIYFYAIDVDSLDSLVFFITPSLSTGETLLCETFVEPSDTGYIFDSGYKHIIWNYGADYPSREIYSDGIVFEITIAQNNYTPGNCYPYIYIADTYNHRIVRIDDVSGEGWISLGSRGSSTGGFNIPSGISVSDSGTIYVADYNNNRIVKMDNMSGVGWTTYTHFGSGIGEFDNPIDLEVTDDYLYVIDFGNSRIVRMDDIYGTNWVSFGSYGSGYGNFNNPSGIAVDNFGRIYIADSGNYRIVRMNSISGDGWVTFGVSGTEEGSFEYPVDVEVFEDDKIYISDRGNNSIIRIDNMSGEGWYEVSDSLGLGADFENIFGISGSSRIGLLVLDHYGNKLVKLELDSLSLDESFGGVSGDGVGEFNRPRAIDISW